MSRSEQESAPYWQDDVALGEAPFFRGETFALRLRLHTSTEWFTDRQELVPLRQPRGERTYLHGTLYILVPDITLTVALHDHPTARGAIGEVTASEWTGMRHETIGQCQAWYYPADQLLVLWECFAEERYRRGDDPRQDPVQRAVWAGFETLLHTRFPAARQLVTTWEDLYARPRWQAFL